MFFGHSGHGAVMGPINSILYSTCRLNELQLRWSLRLCVPAVRFMKSCGIH